MVAKRQFNDVSFQRLKNAVTALPGLAASLAEQNLSLHKIEEIHVFGYGSLPDQPHYMPDDISDAWLWNYSRDMCCKSIRSGTSKFTGLTLGLDEHDGGIVPGSLLTYRTSTAEQICEMLEALAEREIVAELPIYEFKMLDIERADGTAVKAIVCIADKNSAGYHGDGLSPLEQKTLSLTAQEELSITRKAKIIAEANGFLTTSGKHATSKSYFDRFVRFPIEQNPVNTDENYLKTLTEQGRKRQLALAAEQERMLKLAKKIDYYRARLKEDLPYVAKLLEDAEHAQLIGWQQKKAEAHKKRKPPSTS